MMTMMSSSLHLLEIEVEQEANSRSLDVLFLLIDRMEYMFNHQPTPSLKETLTYYINLKLCRHRLKKKFFDWGNIDAENYCTQLNSLTDKIKKAREKYYDTKRRYENDRTNHGTNRVG